MPLFPIASKASSPHSLHPQTCVPGLLYAPWGARSPHTPWCRQSPDPVPGTDFTLGCQDPHPLSNCQGLRLALPLLSPLHSWENMSGPAWLSPVQTSSCSPCAFHTQPPMGGSPRAVSWFLHSLGASFMCSHRHNSLERSQLFPLAVSSCSKSCSVCRYKASGFLCPAHTL